mgnify:CR=1 FL=1
MIPPLLQFGAQLGLTLLWLGALFVLLWIGKLDSATALPLMAAAVAVWLPTPGANVRAPQRGTDSSHERERPSTPKP